MPQIVADRFTRPGSGLVNGMRAMTLNPDEFAFLQNVKPYAGNIVSRGGTVAQGSSLAAATVTWLFHAYGTSASAALVVRLAMCGTLLRYKIGAGVWTDLLIGLTAGTYPVAVAYKGHVYWCDGTNTPQDITIANPPTITPWVTLPAGINPTWVVLHKNRLKYGGDLTTPNYYYMTEFGTPGTTESVNFYLQPDDQNGNYPKIAVNVGNRVALFCQDFLVSHSGTGPNTDQFFPFPRGAACTAWRSVVDMGEFGVFYLTERGVFAFDGGSPPEPLDPFNRVNWSDFDMTTEALIWALRVGDEYRLYFKSKGDLQSSTATAATILASSTARTRFTTLWAARNATTVKPFVAAGTVSHYYSYDCRLKIWSGPHTGVHLCGAWEQYRYGDTQDPWVGDATTGGLVLKADQQSAFTDNGTPFDCIIRTGVIGNAYHKTEIIRIIAKFGICYRPEAKVRVAVWQNGSNAEPPASVHSANLYFKAALVSASASNKPTDYEDFVQIEFTPKYDKPLGLEPQIEYRFASGEGFEFRGHEIEFKEA